MLVNRQTLADALGISKPTVTSWLDDGLPFTRRGSKGVEWEFNLPAVIEWYAEHKHRRRDARARAQDNPFVEPGEGLESEEDAKARKERALADRHEIDAAKSLGILVPIDEVRAIVTDEHARVRARLMSIPNAVRPLALTYLNNDRKAVEGLVAIVDGVIVDALTEVTSYLTDEVASDAGDE